MLSNYAAGKNKGPILQVVRPVIDLLYNAKQSQLNVLEIASGMSSSLIEAMR